MTSKGDSKPITDSSCLEAMDHVYDFLNGELDDRPDKRALVEHHLGHCRSCFSRAEMERLLSGRIRESGRQKAPDALKQRLRALLKDS